MRPAMLFGNFQIIHIYIIDVIVSFFTCESIRLASEQVLNERTNARNDSRITHYLLQKTFIIFSFYRITLNILIGRCHFSLSNFYFFRLRLGPCLKITMLHWNYALFQLAMADAQILTTTWKPKNTNLV